MTKEFYLPRGKKERRKWLNNFNTQLAEHGIGLGITPAEIAAVQNDAKAVNYMLDNLEIFNAEKEERTRYTNLLFDGRIGSPLGDLPGLPALPPPPAAVPPGVFKRIAKMVQRIKSHPNYNEALGKNLGIIGPEKVIDWEKQKVRATLLRSDATGVAFDFYKGKSDGVVIYEGSFVHENNSASEPLLLAWTERARANISPWIDTRENKTSQPEARNYKMRYLKKDKAIGLESDILSVIAVKYKSEN
jgi:hypothetical protein